jgi:hypothetical protein
MVSCRHNFLSLKYMSIASRVYVSSYLTYPYSSIDMHSHSIDIKIVLAVFVQQAFLEITCLRLFGSFFWFFMLIFLAWLQLDWTLTNLCS